MAYTFGTVVEGDIASVRPAVEAALAAEGFGILTEIDVAATLKAKLDVDRDPYLILGACNPALANEALAADENVGALLPCSVVLRQEGANVAVRFMDPMTVLGLVGSAKADEAATDARGRLERVSASLGA
ncbi:MAG: DUF302 domain-containing protein [Acidimicrobiia bacterium]